MLKVSIIVPIYNAEQYLEEAIESVLKQTYTNFELLLINDASTDNSKDICKKYGQQDARIVLLENESESHGPGPTRNIGLEYATGEYIYFMDADDWIEHNLLECSVQRMQEACADIVQFGMICEWDDKKKSQQYCWKGKDFLTKNEIQKNFFYFWKEKRISLWQHLFRREIVKTIRFEHIVNGEDLCFALDALSKAERIAYIAEVFYHYRYVERSTSHRWIKDSIEIRGIIWDHQKIFLKSFHEDMEQLVYSEVAYTNYIWAIYQLSSNFCPLSYKEKKKALLNLKRKMDFDTYRHIYPVNRQHGIEKVKYTLVKYHLENILLLFGPIFLKIIRGE